MSHKFKKHLYYLLGFAGIVLLGIFVSNSLNQPVDSIKTADSLEDGSAELQVPLADTLAQRNKFINEFVQNKSRDKRDFYEKWLGIIGANGIIDSVQKVAPLCHDEEHDLGKVIYSKVQDVGNALRTCEDSCNSGCMHGVLMEFFATKKNAVSQTQAEDQPQANPDAHIDLDDVKDSIDTICGIGDKTGNAIMASMYKQGDCAHGVGHALMYLANYDITKAMNYCSLFTMKQLAYYCATGAYMEYITTHDKQDTETNKDIFFPCVGAQYPGACFRYKMAHVVPRFYNGGGTVKGMQDLCLKMDVKDELGCLHGMGNGNYAFLANNQVTVQQLCNVGTQDDQYVCIEGAIERLARYLPDRAKLQCSTLTTDWQNKLCMDDVGHELYDLTKPFDLYLK